MCKYTNKYVRIKYVSKYVDTAIGQSINFKANVTFAEINEEISMTCTNQNDRLLSLYFPEQLNDSICNTASQQCTITGKCESTSLCQCCVEPITSSCNTNGQLVFTVKMSNLTLFGSWYCFSFSFAECASFFVHQYCKYSLIKLFCILFKLQLYYIA